MRGTKDGGSATAAGQNCEQMQSLNTTRSISSAHSTESGCSPGRSGRDSATKFRWLQSVLSSFVLSTEDHVCLHESDSEVTQTVTGLPPGAGPGIGRKVKKVPKAKNSLKTSECRAVLDDLLTSCQHSPTAATGECTEEQLNASGLHCSAGTSRLGADQVSSQSPSASDVHSTAQTVIKEARQRKTSSTISGGGASYQSASVLQKDLTVALARLEASEQACQWRGEELDYLRHILQEARSQLDGLDAEMKSRIALHEAKKAELVLAVETMRSELESKQQECTSIRNQLAAVLVQQAARTNEGTTEVSDLVKQMKEVFESEKDKKKEAEMLLENQKQSRIVKTSKRFMLRWQAGLQAMILSSWWTSASSERKLKLASRKVVQRRVGVCLTAALCAWQEHSDQSRALNRIAAKVLFRVKNRTLAMVWNTWVQDCTEDVRAGNERGEQAKWMEEAFSAMQEDLGGMLARIEAVERAAAEAMSVRFF